jgi:hypothetical protein
MRSDSQLIQMMKGIFHLSLALCVIMGLTNCQSGKKKVVLAIFSQGNDMDSPKSIFRKNIEGRAVVFKVIPEFTHRQLVAFHPFPAEDGTYGITLKLDFKGTQSLDLVTRTAQGEVLLSTVNGTTVDYVMIDRPVSDGLFTIWRGLPEALITLMDEQYPRISELKESKENSASESLDMLPSTGPEKRRARKRAEKQARDKAEGRLPKEMVDPNDPEIPNGEPIPLSEALESAR